MISAPLDNVVRMDKSSFHLVPDEDDNAATFHIELAHSESERFVVDSPWEMKNPLPPSPPSAFELLYKSHMSSGATQEREMIQRFDTPPQQPSASATPFTTHSTRRISGGILSERIFQQVKQHQLQVALRQRRGTCSLRRVLAIALFLLPIILFASELIHNAVETKNSIEQKCWWCLYQNNILQLESYFTIVAVCGGFGAVLVSDEYWNYSLARWMGGFVSSSGSLVTIWMVSKSLASDKTGVLVLATLFVAILGSMPGVLVYFVVKIGTDECFNDDNDVQSWGEGYASLTMNLRANDEEIGVSNV